MVFRCSNIQEHYNEAVIYLNLGTPKNIEFSIWNKWKIYYFWVSPILKHIRVEGVCNLQVLHERALIFGEFV